MYVPFLGRLSLIEWPFVIVSLLLVWIEFLVSTITNCIPAPVIKGITNSIKLVYQFFRYNPTPNDNTLQDSEETRKMNNLQNAKNLNEMCILFDYEVENHVIKTSDNYLLNLHRIKSNLKSTGERVSNGKIVYFHHGLLMSSEIWCTMINKNLNLPFVLYDMGYDVWLGNNRGNKYSNKHIFLDSTDTKYWDFGIDQFALFDIPDTINYVLNYTKKDVLTYIGFSQGSAQAFASVSINPDLNDKIDKLIAISPATTPHGLYTKFIDILLKSSPNLMYLFFGKRILLPSATFWQRIIYPPLFDNIIDLGNWMLFNWKSYNIAKAQKISSYAHLYSTTSVKSVVHWFQIISHKNFQMFKDNFISYNEPISYPLSNIRIPIYLIYGTADSLVDIEVMKSQLPNHTVVKPIKNYEHLDNIWGQNIDKLIFPFIFDVLSNELQEETELVDDYDASLSDHSDTKVTSVTTTDDFSKLVTLKFFQ